jgi:hypothetical protein
MPASRSPGRYKRFPQTIAKFNAVRGWTVNGACQVVLDEQSVGTMNMPRLLQQSADVHGTRKRRLIDGLQILTG